MSLAGMKRTSVVIIVALMIPSVTPVTGAEEFRLPRWVAGDTWVYTTLTKSPYETLRGNMSVSVTGEGRLRTGNETHSVYILSLKKKEMSETYTRTTVSRIYVAKATLCTIQSRSTIEVTSGSLRSMAELTLTYTPSDGRYLFPLALNRSWRSWFNVTRIEVWEGVRRVSEHCLTINYICGWAGTIKIGKTNYTAFLVNCTEEGSGNYTNYWYSEKVRGDVKVETYDAASGALSIITLKKYSRFSGGGPLLGPDTERIVALLGVSLVLLGAAAAIGGASRLRERLERREGKGPTGPPVQYSAGERWTTPGLKMQQR
ncbi:MAG: hypothetical protein QXH42_00350 [Thermoplasmata archaeon]